MRSPKALPALLATLIGLAGAASGRPAPPQLSASDEAYWQQEYRERQVHGAVLLGVLAREMPGEIWIDRLTLSGGGVRVQGGKVDDQALGRLVGVLDRLPAAHHTVIRQAIRGEDGVDRYLFEVSLGVRRGERWGGWPQGYAAPAEVPEVLRRLRARLGTAGIRLRKFAPGTPASAPAMPVEVELEAASYRDLVLLVDGLARFTPVVAIDRLEVTRAAGDESALAAALTLAVPAFAGGGGHLPPPGAAGLPPVPARFPHNPFQRVPGRGTALGQHHPAGIPGLMVLDLDLAELLPAGRGNRGGGGHAARVRMRRTGQTYTLKAGDALYDGEVAQITATELVLRRRLSEGGETREVVLRPR
jgi:hypothetical protein